MGKLLNYNGSDKVKKRIADVLNVTDVQVDGVSIVNGSGVAHVPVPTSTSDLDNDSGFITNTVNNLVNYYTKTNTYTKQEVDSLIGSITTISFEVVQTLPTTNIKTNVIYLLPKSTAETNNVYDEYINPTGTTSGWEKIGETTVDLSNYYTKTEIDNLLDSKADMADLADVATSGSYTDLSDKPSIPTKTSDLTNDSDFVSDASYVHTDNNYTTTEKNKLSGIASGAEVNVQSDWNQTDSTKDDYIKNKPSIPAEQVNSDWNATSGKAQILNKPSIPNVATKYDSSDAAETTLADDDKVPFYDTSASGQRNSTWANIKAKLKSYFDSIYSTFSGSYNDLSNKPTLGTASAKDVPASGNASTTQVVMGNDSRLSDSRPASDVSAWAKASTKPTYTASEVGLGNVPNVATNDQTPTFTQATTRANIASGEKLSVIFGKIMKWFADLKTVAFTGSYNDLSDKPTIPTVNNATLTIQKNGTNVQTFTANQSTNATANITVPTKVSELTNDSGYTTNTGTVTSVATGTGLTGGTITGSGTISIASHSADYLNGGYINIHPENTPTLIPFMNNDIAYLLKRGGSAVVKYDDTTQSVSLTNCFDASPSYWAINPTGVTTITIELTLHKAFTWTNTIYVDFGASGWRAKSVKIEVINTNYASDVWTQKYNNTNNSSGHCYVATSHTPVGASNAGGGFNKIRFTFSSWNSATIFRIAQLGVYNYGSTGLRETFLPKDGGNLYGNIYPNSNNGANLGTTSNYWNAAYITSINGVTVGSSPKFTDTDTKVTSVGNHYTPAEDTSAVLSADASSTTAATWNSTSLVTGVDIKRDAKGHVVGVAVDSIRMPANPNTNTDTLVTQTNTTGNASYRILFSENANDTTETKTARKNTNLRYNPSTGNLQTIQLNGVTIGSSPKFTDTIPNWAQAGSTFTGAVSCDLSTYIGTKTLIEVYIITNVNNSTTPVNCMTFIPGVIASATNAGTFRSGYTQLVGSTNQYGVASFNVTGKVITLNYATINGTDKTSSATWRVFYKAY